MNASNYRCKYESFIVIKTFCTTYYRHALTLRKKIGYLMQLRIVERLQISRYNNESMAVNQALIETTK